MSSLSNFHLNGNKAQSPLLPFSLRGNIVGDFVEKNILPHALDLIKYYMLMQGVTNAFLGANIYGLFSFIFLAMFAYAKLDEHLYNIPDTELKKRFFINMYAILIEKLMITLLCVVIFVCSFSLVNKPEQYLAYLNAALRSTRVTMIVGIGALLIAHDSEFDLTVYKKYIYVVHGIHFLVTPVWYNIAFHYICFLLYLTIEMQIIINLDQTRVKPVQQEFFSSSYALKLYLYILAMLALLYIYYLSKAD